MRQYIARRLLQSVVILVVLSIVVFVLLRIAPGADPALLRCGVLTCTEERLDALRNEMGLHDPYFPVSADTGPPFVHVQANSQYWRWVKQLGTGSLGKDWNNVSVASELQKRLPVTVELLLITVLATVVLGVPFGIISAIARNSPADYWVRFSAVLGLSVPNFWIATLVLLIPLQYWHYAPPLTVQVSFFDDPWTNLKQFVPPALVLAAASAASVMRLTRSAMLEVMRQDYIRTARAKGLREQVVIGRHALKNSLIPVITVIGLLVAGLFGGSIIIESIFNLRGVGLYELNALVRRDFGVAQTLTIYAAMVVVLLNLLVDITYAWLDPRIRYS